MCPLVFIFVFEKIDVLSLVFLWFDFLHFDSKLVQKIEHHFRKSPITIENLDTIAIITATTRTSLRLRDRGLQ